MKDISRQPRAQPLCDLRKDLLSKVRATFEMRLTAIIISSSDPRTRLKFGERAFSVAAPQACNRLPTELKLMRSTPAFKRSLKHSCSRVHTAEIELN